MEIGLLFGGCIFSLIGGALIWQQLSALLYFSKTTGTVVALEKRTTPASGSKKKGGPMYYPVIEYIAKGNKKSFTGSMGVSWPYYEIGEEVKVLYSVKKDQARIKSMIPFVMGIIFGGVGVALCIAFFNTFSFSFFSTGFSVFIGFMIIRGIWKALKKRDISSWDELKESFRNTKMKTKEGIKPEQTLVINSAEELDLDKAKKTKTLKYVGPIFTLVGIAVLALGIYLGIERKNFLETALSTDGEVVELNRKRSDDSYVYYPVVEFSPPGSTNTLTFEHDSGSNPPSYSVGESVEVLYDPQNPNEAIIDAGLMNWFGTGIASFLGLIFTLVGVSSVRRWSKYRKVVKKRNL